MGLCSDEDFEIRGAYCPACGQQRLVVRGNQLLCDMPGCPRPSAAAEILSDPETEHVVMIDRGTGNVVVKHPLRERVTDELFACDVLTSVMETPSGRFPRETGQYRVTLDERGDWNFARIE